MQRSGSRAPQVSCGCFHNLVDLWFEGTFEVESSTVIANQVIIIDTSKLNSTQGGRLRGDVFSFGCSLFGRILIIGDEDFSLVRE
ncbi:unnamed protein product [Sphenostylis stenocarpa]|uniref:Uncharacterized protein n=1 Tax=Sphenostylis stenocarpa TaxID=92480 RepID=A0AA86SZV1_9FABA|nr:unnamed protein product [Sphenostylis stenocarpa]